jgi:hypothetical protein
MTAPDPEAHTHALIDRIAAILNEVHELGQQLQRPPQPDESASAEMHRLLYFALAGLLRTMEDVLKVLRHASQPLGPMGAEWLERQARALKGEDG